MTGPGQAVIPAGEALRRLRGGARSRPAGRALLMDLIPWSVPAAVAVAIGAVRPLARLLAETGWAVPGAPGRLFVVAALLLLAGGLVQVLRSAGPVTASSAFWFWLLSAPVRRRDLLRRRGQGLWTAGHVAAASMDIFMLTEFLSDRRARQAGRVRPARIGAWFAAALARSEWIRLRRRPYLAVRAAAAAVAWWGCRPVLPGPALAAVAVITGYCLVLPAAGTLRQLTANPALRAQFFPRDRWLSVASLAACLLVSAVWTAITAPGLGGGIALAVLITAGLTAAVYRTVTRRPLDYSGPLVPTPFGDYPLDLWRQIFRGPLLLAVLTALTAAITAR